MKNNRRDFLKQTGLAGMSLLTAGLMTECGADQSKAQYTKAANAKNMSGYAAPKLQTARIGFIGLGSRGPYHALDISLLEGVEIMALCDLLPEECEKVRKQIEFAGFNPTIYTGGENEWKKMCERPDIDLVSLSTDKN